MNLFQSLVLGVIQGVTELLPISSSAHLILAREFLKWPDLGLAFDVALHWGTLFGVVLYFWKDLLGVFLNFLKTRGRDRFAWLLILATLPGAVAGYFLNDYAETVFRSSSIIVFTLVGFSVLLYLADKYGRHTEDMENLGWGKGFLIGVAQALAIVPGVSRSGATITAGLFFGLERKVAARFSFLLSAPIIFGAGIVELPNLFSAGELASNVLAGTLAAAVSGFLAIKFLFKYLEKNSFKIFVWYRLILAGLILAFL